MNRRHSQLGFTLLEVLIAVAIFALISTATFLMLQQTLKTSDSFETSAENLVELQRAYRLFQQDISQSVPRSIRDEFGDVAPAFIVEEDGWGPALELTRAGRPNPLNLARSTMQRVRYFINDNTLYRRTWKQLDRAPQAAYQDQIVLKSLTAWHLRIREGDEWIESWPSQSELSKQSIPLAIEITLSMTNDTDLRWLFSMSQVSSGEPEQ